MYPNKKSPSTRYLSGCESCGGELAQLLDRHDHDVSSGECGLVACYRPVANLAEGGIYGHLATLHSAPDRFVNPVARLARIARRQGRLGEWESLVLRLMIEQFVRNQGQGCLIVPLGEATVSLGAGCATLMKTSLRKANLVPERLVVIHSGIGDLEGEDLVNSTAAFHGLRQLGVRLAAGTLHCPRSEALLWQKDAPEFMLIEEGVLDAFEPNQLKVSRYDQLIRDRVAAGRRIIATGVETLAMLKVLQGSGVGFACGHFIGKPTVVPTCTLAAAAHKYIAEKVAGIDGQSGGPLHVLEKMLQAIPPVAPDTMAEEVFRLFELNPELRAVAVVKNERPLGMIARYEMIDNMARPYRHELYGRKSCTRFMDADPLVVELRLSLLELSEILVHSHPRHMISGFIITDEGHYVGIGSVQDLVREVTAMQIEAAKYANPLSQLPGNVPINQHIDNLLVARAPFIIAYCDLDHFKPFNDVYGYARGDDVIRLTARVLAEACDPEIDFIGHIGGDDFVLVLRSEDWLARCERVLRLFGEEILGFFSRDDVERGGYVTENRKGNMEFHALTSLSIGVVEAQPGIFRSHLEISVVAAEVKKKAKGIKGNSLAVNRRAY